jgi:ATP-binding cassette subfamily B protein/subfamily B ATP-binding cassette protein MsbA
VTQHEHPAAPAGQKSLVAWTLPFLGPYRARVAVVTVLLLTDVALNAFQPWPLKIVIDYVLANAPLPTPLSTWLPPEISGNRAALLIFIVAGGALLQVVNQFISAYATQVQVDTGQRMVYDLRYRLFQHLQSLGLHHHVATPTGDAVYRVDVDAYAVENLLIGGFPLATSVITLVVMFAILLERDVTVALLSLAVMPFLYLSIRYYMTTLLNREERVKELESNLVQRLYETFSAIRLVKSFGRESHEVARYSKAGRATMAARIALTWQQSLFSALVTTITILGTGFVVIVGGIHVMRGQMSVGDLWIVIAYLGAVYGPLSAIAHASGQLQGALAGVKRLRAAFDMEPEAVDAPDAVDATGIKGHIQFEEVGFSYPDGTRVLRDINFSARPGEMVALVGLTGAGKTTLVSLIPRLYDATSGRILVDGIDVRRYRIRDLRERIAIVLQDPVLFSGTIADNLRYGKLHATPEEIERAARAAHAHEFVSRLPRGYDTEIAEAGGSLSGGERQRLSVARAILKNAPILILDEPTSSLDAISEEIVFAALRRLRAGRTTIVIAHRLSTVRDADRILVLDGGQIAAQGRHDELLKSSLLYRRMCARLSVGRSLDEPETVDELMRATRS